jgi:bacterial/archaeal transporter family protein
MSQAPPAPLAEAVRKLLPLWLVYSVSTILLWGVWGAVSKAVASDINAYMNQVLFTIGLIPLLVLVVRSSRLTGGKHRKRGISYAFLTGILGGTGNILFFTSLTMGGSASVVVPMTSLSPLVTVVLAFLALREKISSTQVVGLVLAFAAIYLLSR